MHRHENFWAQHFSNKKLYGANGRIQQQINKTTFCQKYECLLFNHHRVTSITAVVANNWLTSKMATARKQTQ